jgi:hypothetical protein
MDHTFPICNILAPRPHLRCDKALRVVCLIHGYDGQISANAPWILID